MLKTVVMATILALCTNAVVFAVDTDPCLALIPKQGAFQLKLSANNIKTFNSSKEWFCSDDFLQYAKQSGLNSGLTVPIEGVPVAGHFDTSNAAQMASRQSFCSDEAKQFSQAQNSFLFIKQGDPTLVNGFVSCEGGHKQPFLHVEATQKGQDLFEIDVDSAPFPADNPLIVEVRPVLNAVPLVVDSFVPGTKVPFDGTGATALSGTYSFAAGSTEAAVAVRTTIGEKTAIVYKCKQGNAGKWKSTSIQNNVAETPDGIFTQSWNYPQASCHPHCCPGCGDWVTYYAQSTDGDLLRNPRSSCDGGGCPFDHTDVIPLTSERIQLNFKTRSLGGRLTLTADKIKIVKSSQRVTSQQGELAYGKPFSVTLNSNKGDLLSIQSSEGTQDLTPQTLQAGGLPAWLISVADPQQTAPDQFIYTLKVVDTSCHQ